MAENPSTTDLTALAKSKAGSDFYKGFYGVVVQVGPVARLCRLVFSCGEFCCKHLKALAAELAEFCEREAPSALNRATKPSDAGSSPTDTPET